MVRSIWVIFTLAASVLQAGAIREVTLTPAESTELQVRLRNFADPANAGAMNVSVPRHYANGTPVPVSGNTRAILQSLCRGVAKRYFPALSQSTWEAPADYDRLPKLTRSWIDPNRLTWDPSQVPIEGKTKLALWSGDYWSLRSGATSFRYQESSWFTSYDEAVASYTQPNEWQKVSGLGASELTPLIQKWSPAEKWDLTIADPSFTLTRQQKATGARYRDASGDVASWMGLCHGWAAASIMVPRPDRPVDIVGTNSVPVRWFPDEVRAMVTLAWANAEIPNNTVGGRCDSKNTDTFANGRLKQPECFDTNPSTFYLALANLIGRQGSSFVMDVSFDYQVWNQPVVAYRFQYFDPTDPSRTSDDWRKVAVDYDRRFKTKDRFQNPMTRGIRDASGNYNDSQIKKVVGVAATVGYLAETHPSGTNQATPDEIRRMTFTFDLELYEANGGGYLAFGGEWHENAHPDFLWIPRAGISALTAYDRENVAFTGTSLPSAALTQAAVTGSQRGYPICRVLKALIDVSSGTRTYKCTAR